MALTYAQNHRHPGVGRDPDLPMLVTFLDSGLRRNDEQGIWTGLFGLG